MCVCVCVCVCMRTCVLHCFWLPYNFLLSISIIFDFLISQVMFTIVDPLSLASNSMERDSLIHIPNGFTVSLVHILRSGVTESLCTHLLKSSWILHATRDRFSHVWLFETPRTVARQAPLSMGFSRQEHWSGLPCPPPGDLPDPGIKPVSLRSPAGRLLKHQGHPNTAQYFSK